MDAETRALIDALRRTSHPIGREQRERAADALERIYAAGFEAAKEKAGDLIADKWSRPADLSLRCGEMTAQERRTAVAVSNGIAAAIRALAPNEVGHDR